MDPSAGFMHATPTSTRDTQIDDHATPNRTPDTGKPSISVSNARGWRRIVLNFTPSWFATVMGTGIASILLHNLPYNGAWLYWLSVIVFCINILLFLVCLSISVLRYTLYPGLFMAMIEDPVQSLFLGTAPMGLATLINMIVFVCVPAWGDGFATLAWVLWIIDAVIALSTCVMLPFVIMYKHRPHDLSGMTAVWLLPVVATIVAAATGGIVAEVLPDKQHALWTVIVSYILWGTGFPLAMVIMVVYFFRLTTSGLPPRAVIVSVFLPLGPIGQGSFGLMQLGRVAREIFPATNTLDAMAGSIFYNFGHYAALIIWGYGLVWLFFAMASITRSKFPFNMGESLPLHGLACDEASR
jgi:tellurite resistance protein TehA-like permease